MKAIQDDMKTMMGKMDANYQSLQMYLKTLCVSLSAKGILPAKIANLAAPNEPQAKSRRKRQAPMPPDQQPAEVVYSIDHDEDMGASDQLTPSDLGSATSSSSSSSSSSSTNASPSKRNKPSPGTATTAALEQQDALSTKVKATPV